MLKCESCGSYLRGRRVRIANATGLCPYCGQDLTQLTDPTLAPREGAKVDPGATSEET